MNARLNNLLGWIFCIIIAIVLALIIRFFVGTPTVVNGESMYPTLYPNERLILNRLPITFFHKWKRYEIITFEAPTVSNVSIDNANLSNPVAVYEKKNFSLLKNFSYYILEINKISYIKRIIGLPGEHIEIKNGRVYKNGLELSEPYLNGLETPSERKAIYRCNCS